MSIWSAEIKELERLRESLKDLVPNLEKELAQLVVADDPNVILLYSRRCLEVIITDLCECELKRPRKTEPLQGIIDKLNKESKVPPHIIASMHGLNELSTYGAHPKDFDPEQVKPVLINLGIIIKWYVKCRGSKAEFEVKSPEEVKRVAKSNERVKKSIHKPYNNIIGLISGTIVLIGIMTVLLFLTHIIGGGKKTNEIEKSIAILPFKSLSIDPEKQYLADGMMDAITLHLSKIKELRVLGRTSTEQYRNPTKTLAKIGNELGVNYLLEGSFQKAGDNARLIVQLIKTGKEGHVWANEYDRNWNDVFNVESEVSQKIAEELDAAITPNEKQLIEKNPTANLNAYDFYQRGREEYWNYANNGIENALDRSENLFHKALQCDPKFAQAYSGLAMVYQSKYLYKEFLSRDFLDSVLILSNIALSHDDQLSEAHLARGLYYNSIEKNDLAIEEFKKAEEYNPNDWMIYFHEGRAYNSYDLVKSIDSFLKAATLNHGSQLPTILRYIASLLFDTGFPEKAKKYHQDAFNLDGDSSAYYRYLANIEFHSGNFKKATELEKRYFLIDTSNIWNYFGLGSDYMYGHQPDKALFYFEKFLQKKGNELSDVDFFGLHRIAWAYRQNGDIGKSDFYLNKCIENLEQLKKLNRAVLSTPLRYDYDLAAAYAFKGDRTKAYENLNEWSEIPEISFWWLPHFYYDPLFDNIRNEPEFQKIYNVIESKCLSLHERVRKLLEEQHML